MPGHAKVVRPDAIGLVIVQQPVGAGDYAVAVTLTKKPPKEVIKQISLSGTVSDDKADRVRRRSQAYGDQLRTKHRKEGI